MAIEKLTLYTGSEEKIKDNYYANELNKLNLLDNVKIQLVDDENKTNFIDLNKESIKELKVLLHSYEMIFCEDD